MEKYFKLFILDVFISLKYVYVKVMYCVMSLVVFVVMMNVKDLWFFLFFLLDVNVCRLIG